MVGIAAEDELAGGEVLDAVADLGDDTGEVHSHPAGALRGPEAAGEDREVDGIESGVEHLDPHLTRAGLGDLDLGGAEFVDVAVAIELDACGHGALLASPSWPVAVTGRHW